jgi:hypothetical protein
MVGLTRAGKSCTFNWILGRDMIGVGDEIEAHYVNLIGADKSVAELGNDFTSVTLIPNIADLSKETSLVDMAGYFDSRNYIGVMGVSYFLKSVFEQVDRVKFLIVFNEHNFFESTGSGITKTFLGFLNMFRFDLFTPELKEELFSTVSLVITRSKQAHLHSAYLKRIGKKLKEPNFKIEFKELMNELVDKMIEKNRIIAFESARPETHPDKCHLMEDLDGLGWEYMDVRKAEQTVGSDIINIPFEKEYDLLPSGEKDAFIQSISERIEVYTEFTNVLKSLMNTLKENWIDIIDSRAAVNLPNTFLGQVLSVQTVFDHVQHFLEQGDMYNSQELVSTEVTKEYSKLNLVSAIRSVLKIYEVADQVGDQFGTFLENMKAYSNLFSELSDTLLPFCECAEQEKLVLRLKFILQRGFREFAKFYQINPDKISKVNQDMKDKCNSNIFEESSSRYLEHFIKRMNTTLLAKLFPNSQTLEEYTALFEDYRSRYEYSNDPDVRCEEELDFSQQSANISFVRATISLNDGHKVAAANSFVSLLKTYLSQGPLINNLALSAAEIDERLNRLYMMKLQVIKRLARILASLETKTYPLARDYAIAICQHGNEAEEVCQIYELMVAEQAAQSDKLIDTYQNYASFCVKWGRYEQANILLQRKLALASEDYDTYMQTVNSLFELAEDRNRYQDEYKENLQKWRRLPENDSQLESTLDEIEAELRNL